MRADPLIFTPDDASAPLADVSARLLSVAAFTQVWMRCLSEVTQEKDRETPDDKDVLNMSRNLGSMVLRIYPTYKSFSSDLEALTAHLKLHFTEQLSTEVLQ